jgi:hypothetical protein
VVIMKRWTRCAAPLAGLWLAVASPACTQIVGLGGAYSPAIDAPCQTSSDCTSGVCSGTPGWCTQICVSDGDCSNGWCIQNSNQVYACFPDCASDADCGAYGVTGLTCQPTTTADGLSTSICSK